MSIPKVIISTDIGGNDKDDAQSLIHALLYADQVDYRGFVGTTSDARNIDSITPMNRIIEAYAKDLPNLRESGDYPSAGDLRSLITQGATQPDWPGDLSDGARLIIDEARKATPSDPLYVLTWGPIHDAARALHEAPDIAGSVRIISISPYGQDTRNPEAYDWLTRAVQNDGRYADVWWIQDHTSHVGMYATEDGAKDPDANMGWVRENVDGHGALGDLFHDVYSRDLYGNGTTNGLKMGDTPSLLYLLDAANDDDPGASSWGGQFQPSGIGKNVWIDSSDGADRMGIFDGAATVARHREAVWGEFAELLDVARGGGSGPVAPAPKEPVIEEPVVEEPVIEEPVIEEPVAEEPVAETPVAEEPAAEEPTVEVPVTPPVVKAPADEAPAVEDPLVEAPGTADPGGETGDQPGEPEYDIAGGTDSEQLKGGGQSDRIHGGAGDDHILGRGKADLVDGGAGNDSVDAGAEDDTLVYVVAQNAEALDYYSGAAGIDTLRLHATAADMANGALARDIAAFETFIEANYDTATNGGARFSFDSNGLIVRGIERVELVMIDADTTPPPDEVPQTGGDTVTLPLGETAEVTVTLHSAADMPDYEDIGGARDDVMKQSGQTDLTHGRDGDDLILGRGQTDYLDGGAGDDVIRAGAGDDFVFYKIGENRGADDLYQGSAGFDTLTIIGTAEEIADPQVLQELAQLQDFMAANDDLEKNGGETFRLDSLGLDVQSMERVELVLLDDPLA